MRVYRWLMDTILGQIILAIVFYPVGLIWWSPLTDLYWTIGGTAFSIVLILIRRRKDRTHEPSLSDTRAPESTSGVGWPD